MRTIHCLSILAAATTMLVGCQSTSPYWDARFGQATRQATALQIIAPEADRNRDPVAGVDGPAAQGAMTEYSKSFTNPEPQPNVTLIGVGSGTVK